MRNTILLIAGLAAAASVGGCSRETTRDGLRGAGIGAVGGAVAGAIVPGLGVAEGPLGLGRLEAALIMEAMAYGCDRRGREYYIDRNGRRVYR